MRIYTYYLVTCRYRLIVAQLLFRRTCSLARNFILHVSAPDDSTGYHQRFNSKDKTLIFRKGKDVASFSWCNDVPHSDDHFTIQGSRVALYPLYEEYCGAPPLATEEFDPHTQTLIMRNAEGHRLKFQDICQFKPSPTDSVHMKNTKSVLMADLQEKYCQRSTTIAKKDKSFLFVYIGAGILLGGTAFALYSSFREK